VPVGEAHKESYIGLGVNIKHVLWEANKSVECLVNLGSETNYSSGSQ
jgi:hypothetical protein